MLTSLLLASLMGGCAGLPRPDFSPDGPHFKVVTYNVNWGCPRPERVADYLREADADVVCLQETHPGWEAFLKKRLGSSYPHFSFHHARGAGGIAFLSKRKLGSVSALAPTAGWFPALLAEAETPLGRVQILNVHLRPALSDSGSATPSAYYYSPQIHRGELDSFLAKTTPALPLIVAGDFNENEKRQAVRRLLDRGYADALSQFDRQSDTWTWTVSPGIYLANRYDHILYNNQLHCTGAAVTRVEASDHLPVAAVFVRAVIED